ELVRPMPGDKVDLQTRALSTSQMAKGLWNCAHLLDAGETDEEGKREMRGVPGAELSLRGLGPGHAPVVREVRFDGSDPVIEVVVPKGATLVGRILPPELIAQLDPRDAAHRVTQSGAKRGGPGIELRGGSAGLARIPLAARAAEIAED